MIRLSTDISPNLSSAEGIKLFETQKCYGDIALFWKQDNSDVSVSMLEGSMIIDGKNPDFSELKSFVKMISPANIFSNEDIFSGLNLWDDCEPVRVLEFCGDTDFCEPSDMLSSREVFEILKGAGLFVPKYEFFATDYCLRLNKNRLKYFARNKNAVCISIGTDYVLVSALASLKKGLGGLCLEGIKSQNRGKKLLVCATDSVKEFYVKNGFNEIYTAGYWRK